VKARYDYLPYGEEIASSIGGRSGVSGYGGADSTRQKYTLYERDKESGLDFAQARYYSSAQGRFTSPDESFADQDQWDPQSWGLYVYTGNNPLMFTDPNGLWKKVKDEKTNREYWVAEKGDSLSTLSDKTGIPLDILKQAYQGARIQVGEYVDISGAEAIYKDRLAGSALFISGVITPDEIPKDEYRISLTPSLPGIGRVSRRANQLTQKALDHIVLRHWATSGAKNAGKFLNGLTGKELKLMIDDVVQKGAKAPSRFGRTEYIYDFGRQIGIDIKGRVATRMKVVLEASGDVVTAFPIK